MKCNKCFGKGFGIRWGALMQFYRCPQCGGSCEQPPAPGTCKPVRNFEVRVPEDLFDEETKDQTKYWRMLNPGGRK